ncbi:unnamed protein product, partial [Polarella glacialis]
VAVARAPCQGPDVPSMCQGGVLAGWDGSRIIVAEMQRGGAAATWQMRSRFTLQPGRGSRARNGRQVLRSGIHAPANYSDVQSLQLSTGGHTLSVLHDSGSLLDAWDLVAGGALERWRVGQGGFNAMCHNEQELLFARASEDGTPVLEAALLPPALRAAALDCDESGDATAATGERQARSGPTIV